MPQMATSPGPLTICLLADKEQLIAAVGEMRWREWGHPPEPVEREWWIAATAREAGCVHLPVTWVALDEHGVALGAVALGEFDLEERRDRSPWVMGMIVRPDRRHAGIGRLLLARLEAWAAANGYARAWVATGRANGFYQACGWELCETAHFPSAGMMSVLMKRLHL